MINIWLLFKGPGKIRRTLIVVGIVQTAIAHQVLTHARDPIADHLTRVAAPDLIQARALGQTRVAQDPVVHPDQRNSIADHAQIKNLIQSNWLMILKRKLRV